MGAPSKLDLMAQVLAEAAVFNDHYAAERNGCTTRTVRNYRAKLAKNEALSKLFLVKKRILEQQWGQTAVDFMRRSIAKLDELVQQAGPEQIREVAGAIKIVGELHVTKEALGGQQPSADPPGAEPPAPAGPDGAPHAGANLH